jgi:hypothetical protein
MKYMVSVGLAKETFKDRVRRFLETGGLPPDGVKMLGRWHSIALNQGFVLAETNDPGKIYEWVSKWADLIDLEVYPVIEDEQASAILKKL